MHRRGGEVGEQLRLDLQEISPERVPARHPITSQLPVAGPVLAQRQQVRVIELHSVLPLASGRSQLASSLVARRKLLAPQSRRQRALRLAGELAISLSWSRCGRGCW